MIPGHNHHLAYKPVGPELGLMRMGVMLRCGHRVQRVNIRKEMGQRRIRSIKRRRRKRTKRRRIKRRKTRRRKRRRSAAPLPTQTLVTQVIARVSGNLTTRESIMEVPSASAKGPLTGMVVPKSYTTLTIQIRLSISIICQVNQEY